MRRKGVKEKDSALKEECAVGGRMGCWRENGLLERECAIEEKQIHH
jgi:hypothetical protein